MEGCGLGWFSVTPFTFASPEQAPHPPRRCYSLLKYLFASLRPSMNHSLKVSIALSAGVAGISQRSLSTLPPFFGLHLFCNRLHDLGYCRSYIKMSNVLSTGETFKACNTLDRAIDYVFKVLLSTRKRKARPYQKNDFSTKSFYDYQSYFTSGSAIQSFARALHSHCFIERPQVHYQGVLAQMVERLVRNQ